MPPSGPVRVLVVDDDPRFADALTALLESEGFEVVGHAVNGEEAEELADELAPDVVTMDIDMPVVDGIEATRRLAERKFRVVIVSGSQSSERLGEAVAAGAAATVIKSQAVHVLAPLLRGVAAQLV